MREKKIQTSQELEVVRNAMTGEAWRGGWKLSHTPTSPHRIPNQCLMRSPVFSGTPKIRLYPCVVTIFEAPVLCFQSTAGWLLLTQEYHHQLHIDTEEHSASSYKSECPTPSSNPTRSVNDPPDPVNLPLPVHHALPGAAGTRSLIDQQHMAKVRKSKVRLDMLPSVKDTEMRSYLQMQVVKMVKIWMIWISGEIEGGRMRGMTRM